MVRSNTWGTEFIVYDKGMNPTKIDSVKSMSYSGRMPSGNPDQIRKELCAVTYVSIAFTRCRAVLLFKYWHYIHYIMEMIIMDVRSHEQNCN